MYRALLNSFTIMVPIFIINCFNMKKRIIFFLFFVFFIPRAFSQSGVHDGGKYIKRIENNLHIYGMYDLKSKGDIEKLFFGDFNAPVEFFFHSPTNQNEGASCFRLVRDSLGVYLEVKYVTNYKEAKKEVDDTFVSNQLTVDERLKEYWNEVYKRCNIETRSFPISEHFSEKLFKKMVYFIDTFKAKVIPGIIVDGYSVVFRTVVDENEQWSLWIHTPKGDALRMSDLCRQIIADAMINELDESKYLPVLDTF